MKEQTGKNDFARFLSRNYYITSHLAERLEELKSLSLFTNHKKVIATTITLLEVQLNKIDNIFDAIGVASSLADCESMIAFLENIFTAIQNQNNGSSFLPTLDYISVADVLMQESAKLTELSLAHLSNLNLPRVELYNSLTLQPLKALLGDLQVAI